MTRQFSLRFTLFLFFSDLAFVALALLLATQTRTLLPFGKSAAASAWVMPLPVYLMGVAVWGVTFAALNVYDPRRILYLGTELAKITGAALFAWLTLAGMLYFSYRLVSRLEYVYFLGFYLLLIYTHRVAVRSWFRARGGSRYNIRRVLIVGTGEIAHEIARTVQAHGWTGLVPVGYVTDNGGTEQNGALPVLGRLSDVPVVIREYGVSEIVIALARQDSQHVTGFVQQLQSLPVNIRLIPDYFDMAFLRVNIENFGGMPLLSLKEPVLDPFQRVVKRAFDIVLTLLLLIPALPLMAVIAILIRRDSPGPAIFRQQRLAEGGRLFTMYKFRTMYVGAEAMQDQVSRVDENGHLIHKHADDPRVTRVGRWLRQTSLDELPQLFNILSGEMSLVGPRPEMPWLVDRYEPWQRKRFEVPQGLTGWWQISGRADKPMHLNTEDDLYYIRNYSVWMDLKILWMTVRTVVGRRGAF
jgi:exopolysaccharide biosynthesis polyprenyl glycosylphosphotransferase